MGLTTGKQTCFSRARDKGHLLIFVKEQRWLHNALSHLLLGLARSVTSLCTLLPIIKRSQRTRRVYSCLDQTVMKGREPKAAFVLPTASLWVGHSHKYQHLMCSLIMTQQMNGSSGGGGHCCSCSQEGSQWIFLPWCHFVGHPVKRNTCKEGRGAVYFILFLVIDLIYRAAHLTSKWL